MKTKTLLVIAIFLLPFIGFSQSIENIEYISPFNDDVAAIKKGGQWAFIDRNGELIFDFRSDLVLMNSKDKKYPVFNDGRCLYKKEKDGITYFGFIDKTGKAVIDARYLNATHFNNGIALVLELVKRNVGSNQLLKKPLVAYEYFEAVIDPKAEILYYLVEDPVHVTLDKKFLREPPPIRSKVISKKLIAQLNAKNKWVIKKIQ